MITIEVCFSPEVGLVRVQHVRAALGVRFGELQVVELVVLAGTVVRQTVKLMLKPSGRGEHTLFACPACEKPRAVLHAAPDSRLKCSGCSNHKTRHQKESSRPEWKKYGEDLEDRLLRGVMRKNNTPTKLRRLRAVVDEVVKGDRDRFASAMLETSAALQVADADLVLLRDRSR